VDVEVRELEVVATGVEVAIVVVVVGFRTLQVCGYNMLHRWRHLEVFVESVAFA
jgi:hypothetical protein